MAEIVYRFEGKKVEKNTKNIRGISREELNVFNEHLSLCSQRPLERSVWEKVYDEGTMYCILFEDGVPAARACVEKYSDKAWEVADVRVIKAYRNRGFAYEVTLFVLKYILDNDKNATIRTEEDNGPMRRVISKLGFTLL